LKNYPAFLTFTALSAMSRAGIIFVNSIRCDFPMQGLDFPLLAPIFFAPFAVTDVDDRSVSFGISIVREPAASVFPNIRKNLVTDNISNIFPIQYFLENYSSVHLRELSALRHIKYDRETRGGTFT